MCAWSKNRICQVDYILTKGIVITRAEHELDNNGHLQSEKEKEFVTWRKQGIKNKTVDGQTPSAKG